MKVMATLRGFISRRSFYFVRITFSVWIIIFCSYVLILPTPQPTRMYLNLKDETYKNGLSIFFYPCDHFKRHTVS